MSDIINQIIELSKTLNYLELSALENAISYRRYNMRKEEEKKFKALDQI